MMNWQDRPLAAKWSRASAKVDKLADAATMDNF